MQAWDYTEALSHAETANQISQLSFFHAAISQCLSRLRKLSLEIRERRADGWK